MTHCGLHAETSRDVGRLEEVPWTDGAVDGRSRGRSVVAASRPS